MLRRYVAVLTAAAILGPLGAAVPASASTSTDGPDPTIGLLRLGGDFSAASNTSNFGYVIVHAWEHHLIPKLKAANPNVKVLVYKNMASAVKYAGSNGVDNPLLPAGVGYYWADQNRPDWFLLDTNGNRIEWCDYKGLWHFDVGDPDYQDMWLANVGAELDQYGWDGVMIDDTMASPWAHLCGRKIAKYPTDSDYRKATESFLAKVGPAIQRRGRLVLPNISDADLNLWKRWIGYASGGVREYWTKVGHTEFKDYYGDHHWAFLMDELEATEAVGKAFIGITYSSMRDVQAMRYARASFLLGYKGGPSAMIFHPGKDLDGWSPEWTINVGTPIAPRYPIGDGWRRDFTGGTVLVNPTTTKSITVDLGASYLMPDGAAVTRVTLGPTSGLILRSSSTAPAESVPAVEEPAGGEPLDEVAEPAVEEPAGGELVEEPAEPTVKPIKLTGKRERGGKIKLRWEGARTRRVAVFSGARRIARVRASAGRYVDTGRRARQAWRTYRVCEGGTGRCSDRIWPTRSPKGFPILSERGVTFWTLGALTRSQP